jgi:hypothetical protein
VYVCVFLFVFQYIEQRVALTHYLTCSLPLENTHALTIALNSLTSSLVQLTQERPQQTTIRESHSVHENSIATTESNTEFNLLRGWVAAEQFIEQQTKKKHITTEAHLFTGAHLWYVQFRCIRLSPGREEPRCTEVGIHMRCRRSSDTCHTHTHSHTTHSHVLTHTYTHVHIHTHVHAYTHSFIPRIILHPISASLLPLLILLHLTSPTTSSRRIQLSHTFLTGKYYYRMCTSR